MQKCVDGMREKLKRGEWLGAAPVGYSYDRTHGGKEQKIIINEKGTLIKNAFLWKLEGLSNIQIVNKLRSLGMKMTPQLLSNVFRNPFYCGLISHNMLKGEIVEGKHPALISKELFLSASKLIKRGGYKQKKENEHLPLKQFVKCEKCGSPYSGYIVKKKGLYYYKCNGKKCHCNRSAKIVHDNFIHFLGVNSTEPAYSSIYQKTLEYIYNKEISSGKARHEELSIQVIEMKAKLYTVEERFACGEIEQNIYYKVSEKFKAEIRVLEESIEKSVLRLSNPGKVINFIVNLSSNFPTTWDLGDYTQKQNVQKLLFPNGLRYNKEKDEYLTPRWSSPIAVTSCISNALKGKKNGIPDDLSEISRLVAGAGFEPTTFGL
ncbi:MAG: recombinase family protein [Bacteroidetes bacterium]|nr:recombinase family protein [Bacteroidota bacterium]